MSFYKLKKEIPGKGKRFYPEYITGNSEIIWKMDTQDKSMTAGVSGSNTVNKISSRRQQDKLSKRDNIICFKCGLSWT